MSVATSTALLIAGGVSAAAGVGSAVIGADASKTAANEQATSAQNALAFQEQTQATNQANYAPYLSAGKTNLSTLMNDFSNGTFGPGSVPAFTAPTASEAQQTPGYQFALSQGERGVNASAAASGGALSGGAVKSSDEFAQGLASTTYQNTYNNSLSAYQANLANQAQQFNQLYAPVSLGENAAAQSGNTAQNVAVNAGSLMTQIGNAQAAGTIGVANAAAGGLTGVANATQQAYLYNQLFNGGGAAGGGNGALQYDSNGYPIAGTGTEADSIAAQEAAGF